MSDIKRGDRVKVTLEGEVVYASKHGRAIEVASGVNGGTVEICSGGPALADLGATIEKIDPPVVVFEPGDVVIRKHDNAPILLADQGYVYLRADARGNFYTYADTGYAREFFNSERFRRAGSYQL